MTESFSITPRVIAHLGEDLIKNESIAILELVKNSYDANASKCVVHFTEEKGSIRSIVIADNGVGMNEDTIKTVWLVIGTDNKKKIFEGAHDGSRLPLGEKGVGRLGVHKLGRKISLISKTKVDDEVSLTIDWTKLDTANSLEDFPVEIRTNASPSEFRDGETGTKIIIEDLKCEWQKKQLRDVYRNLMSLNSPFVDTSEDFKVEISSNNPSLFEGLPKFEDIISNGGLYFGSCTMKGRSVSEFSYDFRPWKTLTKVKSGRHVGLSDLGAIDINITGSRVVEGKSKPEDYDIDLEKLNIGEIKFDIIIFEMDSAILNYLNAEKTIIRDYLNENGGVRVYRDNVRVYDYGERDNDWLGIDLKRVHRVGGNVSNNIILGSVRLNRAESTGLKEKTNREGFIEDETYSAFADAVNHVLSIFVRLRNEDKERLTFLYKTNKAVEPVLSSLEDAVTLINAKVEDEKSRRELLKCIDRVNVHYKAVKETLIKSANAGLNLSVVIHEIDKQVAALNGSAERGEVEKVLSISKNIEKIVRGYTAMIKKSNIGLGKLSDVVSIALDNYEFRFSDHGIDVLSNWKTSQLKAQFARAESIAVLTNLLDNAIYWVSKTRHDDRTISVFLTSQVPGYSTIVVSDNGPGFNIGTDVAIQPFISGKPNNVGMGLGLHIANEMMSAMKGCLIFYDEKDITLPEEVVKAGANKAIVALCFPKGE